jgi:hypothetical protein
VVMAEDTFGEATDENINKMRQIITLKNTPRFAVDHVANILGLPPVAKGGAVIPDPNADGTDNTDTGAQPNGQAA